MGYTSVPANFEVLRFAEWWSVQELLSTINAIKIINYSINEQRQQALETWGKMTCVCPFSKVHRFPGTGQLFVCGMIGDWPRKVQQLLTSLSYKSYNKDEKAKTQTGSSEALPDYNDAHMSFRNAITTMMDELYRMDAVFDRSTFEEKFRMAWNEKDPHTKFRSKVSDLEEPTTVSYSQYIPYSGRKGKEPETVEFEVEEEDEK